jgi:hypothetical protein
MVDDQPFWARAGELNNSSASSRAFMSEVWPKLVRARLNTVLAVISWDMFEPEEGRYDFSNIDELIEDARANHIKLVPLWFGTWKNGASHYVPYWVKADQQRFALTRTLMGNIDTISPLNEAAKAADAKAFAALMGHIREVDEKERTVIMVQVENEVGVLGDARDRSEAAERVFNAKAPRELTDYLTGNHARLLPETLEAWQGAGGRTDGTWRETFGRFADEAFSAWHYARFVDAVAAAGKAEYPLPMFVNAWLPNYRNPLFPGEYPSGGPNAHMQDIWRAGAPNIDFLSPDIYSTNFGEILSKYNRAGNPLFIPEARPELEGAANAALAASMGAFGYSPFGIESRIADYDNGPITQVYKLIEEIEPELFKHQAEGTIAGAIVEQGHLEERFVLGGYEIVIGLVQDRNTPAYLAEKGYAIVMSTGPDSFTIAGLGVQVTFAPPVPSGDVIGIGTAEEGRFDDGAWTPGRRLNGDEIVLHRNFGKRSLEGQTGTGLRFLKAEPEIQRVRLYSFKR